MQVRIVNVDFYMHSPIPNLDPMYSEFRGCSTYQLPVLRTFGSTNTGIKTCLHIHGVFPYIYIPYDGQDPINSIMYQLATSLDKAINVSLGQTSSNVQHIFKISLVSGIPFYGYHAKHHQFLKIYFYNPLIVKKACTLLQSGNIMGKIFQPHEAHIPYVLQFMIDYNLYGMSFVNLSEVKYRGTPDITGIPEELILPPSVERMSTCKLEVDALAEHILNRSEVNSQNLALNPGIQALWDDEKQRRRNAGDTSVIENCLTQNRIDVKPTATHLAFLNVLKEKLGKPAKIEENKSENLSVYPAETPRNNTILDASMVENHIDIGTQSSDSTVLDFTITPEDNTADVTLDNDALKLLEILNDLRENIETDSILSQAIPERDSDIEENEIDMSLPLGYVQTPPKIDCKKLDATLDELDDSYFDISINIPQLDGCDDISFLRRSVRLQCQRKKIVAEKVSKRKGRTSSSSEQCLQDSSVNSQRFADKTSMVKSLKSIAPNKSSSISSVTLIDSSRIGLGTDLQNKLRDTLRNTSQSQPEILNLATEGSQCPVRNISKNAKKVDTNPKCNKDSLNFKSFSSRLLRDKESQSSFIGGNKDLSTFTLTSDTSCGKIDCNPKNTVLRSGRSYNFKETFMKRRRNKKASEAHDSIQEPDISIAGSENSEVNQFVTKSKTKRTKKRDCKRPRRTVNHQSCISHHKSNRTEVLSDQTTSSDFSAQHVIALSLKGVPIIDVKETVEVDNNFNNEQKQKEASSKKTDQCCNVRINKNANYGMYNVKNDGSVPSSVVNSKFNFDQRNWEELHKEIGCSSLEIDGLNSGINKIITNEQAVFVENPVWKTNDQYANLCEENQKIALDHKASLILQKSNDQILALIEKSQFCLPPAISTKKSVHVSPSRKYKIKNKKRKRKTHSFKKKLENIAENVENLRHKNEGLSKVVDVENLGFQIEKKAANVKGKDQDNEQIALEILSDATKVLNSKTLESVTQSNSSRETLCTSDSKLSEINSCHSYSKQMNGLKNNSTADLNNSFLINDNDSSVITNNNVHKCVDEEINVLFTDECASYKKISNDGKVSHNRLKKHNTSLNKLNVNCNSQVIHSKPNNKNRENLKPDKPPLKISATESISTDTEKASDNTSSITALSMPVMDYNSKILSNQTGLAENKCCEEQIPSVFCEQVIPTTCNSINGIQNRSVEDIHFFPVRENILNDKGNISILGCEPRKLSKQTGLVQTKCHKEQMFTLFSEPSVSTWKNIIQSKMNTKNSIQRDTKNLAHQKKANKKLIEEINIFEVVDKILRDIDKEDLKKECKKFSSRRKNGNKNNIKQCEKGETNCLNKTGAITYNIPLKDNKFELNKYLREEILENRSNTEKIKERAVKRKLNHTSDSGTIKKVKVYYKQPNDTILNENTVPVFIHIPLVDDTFHKTLNSCHKRGNNTTVNFFEKHVKPKFSVVPSNNRPYLDGPKLSIKFPNAKWYNNTSDCLTRKYPREKQITILSDKIVDEDQKINTNNLPLEQTYHLSHHSLFPINDNCSMKVFSNFKSSMEFESCYKETKETINIFNKEGGENETEDDIKRIVEDGVNRHIKLIENENLRKDIEAKLNNALNSDETVYNNLLDNVKKRFNNMFRDIDDAKENRTISLCKILSKCKEKIGTEVSKNKYQKEKFIGEFISADTAGKVHKKCPAETFKEGTVNSNNKISREGLYFSDNIPRQTNNQSEFKKLKSVNSNIWDYIKKESIKYANEEKVQNVNNSSKNVIGVNTFIERSLFGFATKKDVDERVNLRSRTGIRHSFDGDTRLCSVAIGCRSNVRTNVTNWDKNFPCTDDSSVRYPVNQYNFFDGTYDSSSSDEGTTMSKTIRKRGRTSATQSTSKYRPLDVKYISPTKNIFPKNAASRIHSQDNNTNVRVIARKQPNVTQKLRRKLSFSQIHQLDTTKIQEKITCRFTPQKRLTTLEKIYIDCDSSNSENSVNSFSCNKEILPIQVCETNLGYDQSSSKIAEKDMFTFNTEDKNQVPSDQINNIDLNETLKPCKNSDSSPQVSDDLFSPDSNEIVDFQKTDPAEKYDVEKRYIPIAGSSKMEPQFEKLSQASQSTCHSSSSDVLTPYQKEKDEMKNHELQEVVSQKYSSESNEHLIPNNQGGTRNEPDKNETISSLHMNTDSVNEIISGNFAKLDTSRWKIYKPIQNPNMNSETLIITPKDKPPSRETVENTLKMYNIPGIQFQEPFYSDRNDVTGNVEVGKNVLKIPSNNTVDLPPFKTSFEGIECQKKKILQVLEIDNKKLSAKEILQYKLSTCKDFPVIVTPGRLPPTRKKVEEWIEEQKGNKKAKTDDKQKQKRSKVFLPNSPGRDGEESCDSLSLSPCTPIDADSTIFKLDNNKYNSNTENNDELTKDTSGLNVSPTLKKKSNDDKKIRKIRIQQAKENVLLKSNASKIFDGSKIDHLTNERVVENESSIDQNNSKINLGIRCSDSKIDSSVDSESATLSSSNTIVKNLALNTITNSHQITGATLDNTNNFLMSSHNLNQAKAIKEHLHLTILSIEVVVITRNEYKPNPELDQIKAIIYTLQNDENILNGGFIINSLPDSPSKIKLSILQGIDAKYNLKSVTSELELIGKFVEYVKNCDPDIFVGFEIELLSWGFLIERAYILGLNLTISLSRTPTVTKRKKLEDDQDLSITGRIIIDFWRLLRHEVALTSYTFENIVYHILHQRIPLFSHKDVTYWLQHPTSIYRNRVIRYYSFKTNAILRIMDQLDLIGRTSELAKLFGIQFYEVLSRGSQFRVESMMLRLAKPLNFIPVSPSQQQRVKMRAPESLPLIMEPESKFYTDPVIVLDFQSLYPSIIIGYNYCFSTCLGRIEHLGGVLPFEFGTTQLKVSRKYLKYFLKKEKLNISPCGIAFVNKSVRLGILPRMLQEILDTRLMVKKSLKENSGNRVLERILDARQLGLKLIANVTYGYTAANFSGRMPCIELGDSVVSKGRETLQRAINLVEKTTRWGAKVVYGDTDSLFVLIPGKSKETAFEIGAEIAEAVTNDNPSPVKLKLEKIFQPCILQTKKRYVGYMYESPNQKEPEFLAKGIETVRRDGCPASAKMLEKCLKLLFDTRDVSLIKKYVTRQFSKLLTGRVSIQDLTFAKEYRGSSNYRPGACVPALELARKWTSVDKRNEPRKGERVPYVIVNGPPGQPLIKLVRSPRDLLKDPSLRPNALYYITKVIIPPINRCFLLIGADLNQWFNEMPRKQYQYLPTSSPGKNKTKKNTITQFFSTLDCAICGTLTQEGICTKCKLKPQETSVLLHEKLRVWEQNYHSTLLICQSCCSRQDEISCISLDCPVYYRRIQTDRDLQQSGFIRQLIGTLPDLKF